MNESSDGRFYFWGERALYLGPGLPATVHAHHAVQVCIPLAGPVRLRTGPRARWRAYEGAVIPSNLNHESDVAVPLIATFWLEPDTAAARRVVQAQGTFPIASIERSTLAALAPRFLQSWQERYTAQRGAALMDDVVRVLAPDEPRRPLIDQRVARTLANQAATPHARVSLVTAAAAVALSPSRLAHLFTPAVGIPRRRHLLWLRLRDAVHELAGGASITRAAHAAGFADAPHLTRTFRRMLGFTPSAALQVSRFVQDAPVRH